MNQKEFWKIVRENYVDALDIRFVVDDSVSVISLFVNGERVKVAPYEEMPEDIFEYAIESFFRGNGGAGYMTSDL